MLFRYNSQWRGEGRVDTTMDIIARSLLLALKVEREGHEDRPMVLVSHSMGGLLVARVCFLNRHPDSQV